MMPRIVSADPYIKPTHRDEMLMISRVAEREQTAGPRVGDYIRLADCGTMLRIAYMGSGGHMQTNCLQEGGSFAMNSPYLSYSGSLEPPVKGREIQPTGELKEGSVWFFHHDSWQAHNAVYAVIPCRVYKEV
jgi:hypothetical protein